MLKNRLKMFLIEDYVNLLQIECFCLKDLGNKMLLSIQHVNNKLKNSYESLLFRYGLMDVSLLLLKREIKTSHLCGEFNIDNVKKIQKKIIENFSNLVKHLKLTDVEIDFLIKPLISNC